MHSTNKEMTPEERFQLTEAIKASNARAVGDLIQKGYGVNCRAVLKIHHEAHSYDYNYAPEHDTLHDEIPIIWKAIEVGKKGVFDKLMQAHDIKQALFTADGKGRLPIDFAVAIKQNDIKDLIQTKTVELISNWLKGNSSSSSGKNHEFKYFKEAKKTSESVENCIGKVKIFNDISEIKLNDLTNLHDKIKDTKYYKCFRHALKSNMIEVIRKSDSSSEDKIKLLTQLKDHPLFSEQRHSFTARSETTSQKDFNKAIKNLEATIESNLEVKKPKKEATIFYDKNNELKPSEKYPSRQMI